MKVHIIAVLSLGALLGGCAYKTEAVATAPNSVTLDGRVASIPRKPVWSAKTKMAVAQADLDDAEDVTLAALKPGSAEWWALRTQIDSDRSERMRGKLNICRGC